MSEREPICNERGIPQSECPPFCPHDFGRLEAYVAEYVNDSPAALRVRVTEAQYNAVEMARKADLAERRAEEAEYHVEQLRDARDAAERRIERTERLIDSWERDAPDHSNPVFIGRLRECLRRDPAPVRLREGAVPERQVGSIADLHPERCPMTEHSPPEAGCDSECTGLCGEHHWLDRPESDTRECLICGTEVAG